ncbi:MAG TPA: SCP2 sterol-binding domain-containing protein [Pseudonocardiaceae bacterium]
MDVNDLDPRTMDAERFRELLAGADPAADLAPVSPEAFARLVALASTEQLRAVGAAPALRTRLLDEIVGRMVTQLRPERAAAVTAVVHWRIGDRPDGGVDEYQLVIADGTCTASRGADREPRVSLQVGFVPFLRLVSGNGSAAMMFMTGKLSVRGDLAFAAGLLDLFDIPRPPSG